MKKISNLKKNHYLIKRSTIQIVSVIITTYRTQTVQTAVAAAIRVVQTQLQTAQTTTTITTADVSPTKKTTYYENSDSKRTLTSY